MLVPIIVLVVLAVFAVALVPAGVRIIKQYEGGVLLRLGRFVSVRGPGLNFILPYIDTVIRVDFRIRTLDVPSQEMITSDTVTVKVNAVVYFKVVDAEKAVIQVQEYANATWQIAQTSLRAVIGATDLESLLSRREEVNSRLQQIIGEQTEPWGVTVSVVEVKDVELPSGMQRAMARQAESERERRAKVVHAEGEFEAAERLVEAATVMDRSPAALQLRYLQTLADITTDRSSIVVFPLPMDILRGFLPNALFGNATTQHGDQEASDD
ncbi:MAG: Regulator of protease activity HflC, stomatin/prohibitin superfamily [Chloroflexi bacterium]|jgi:regulator of protease activity HflC (stomatin/prohibitin superfamily)|nr:MAG: Regulator of protease activity HflC, stomatin/prohibitin superfamily [Chloroflexota bacterium]